MCVYFWSDTDKEKADNAIVRILDIIDRAFENKESFVLERAKEIEKALSVRGLYDYTTRDRLKSLLSDPQLFRDELFRNVEKDRSLIKTEGKIGIGDVTPVHTDLDSIKLMRFGMVGLNTLFNARCEEAESKQTWKGLMQYNRCIIPTTQYIETHTDPISKKKTQYLFYLPGKRRIYMAGLWRQEESMFKRFVVLTRQAVGEIEKLHDRMPVILDEDQAGAWLKEGNAIFGHAVHTFAETDVLHEKYNKAG